MRVVNSAILLAAGRGLRLRPYTDTTPKPLLPWRDRPTLDWILDSLQQAGITNVVLVTGHLQEQIQAYAIDRMQQTSAMEIACVTQSTLDGTAGAVSCALTAKPEWFDRSFLVTATDYLVDQHFYPALLDSHYKNNADITISLKLVPENELGKRSSVEYQGDFNIARVVEKPAAGEAPSPYAANLIYVLPSTVIDLIHSVEHSVRGEREIQTAVNQHLTEGGSARGLLQATPDEWSPRIADQLRKR